MKHIIEFVFGRRAKGEKLQPPTLRKVEPPVRLSENEWYQHVNSSSRYGTRGTFYQGK